MTKQLIEIKLKLELDNESINSSGNHIEYYNDYTEDGLTLLGNTVVTMLRATTSSVCSIAGSGGSLLSSNSDQSNSFIHVNIHTVLNIDGHIYVFDSDNITNKNDFKKNRTKLYVSSNATINTTNIDAAKSAWIAMSALDNSGNWSLIYYEK